MKRAFRWISIVWSLRSLIVFRLYFCLRCWVFGQFITTCSSVWTAPHRHRRSSKGSLPLPLLFQRPVSTARECDIRRYRVKEIRTDSKISMSFSYNSELCKSGLVIVLYIIRLELVEVSIFLIISLILCFSWSIFSFNSSCIYLDVGYLVLRIKFNMWPHGSSSLSHVFQHTISILRFFGDF